LINPLESSTLAPLTAPAAGADSPALLSQHGPVADLYCRTDPVPSAPHKVAPVWQKPLAVMLALLLAPGVATFALPPRRPEDRP
jgi:hypothetical protein